ncbi:hypothetical protein N9H95_03210 [Gammaproteobacteria bacterium]|nr:hypothetical protein [Gammaproteobacteria bacterium]
MNKFNINTLKSGVVLSVLFMTACSSTPEPAADMTGVNVSSVTQTYFESTHGCFNIKNSHAKNEIVMQACPKSQFADTMKRAFSYGMYSKEKFYKFKDGIFLDVFNEYKKLNDYLNNCNPTDLIRNQRGQFLTIEIIYKCD